MQQTVPHRSERLARIETAIATRTWSRERPRDFAQFQQRTSPPWWNPDFAHLVIDYAPDTTIVESKSLKLFLGSFRNHCGFHEDVTVGIGQRLVAEMKPQWLRIGGYWYPRGGIPIDVFWQSGPPPEGLWLPDQGVAPYRGRG